MSETKPSIRELVGQQAYKVLHSLLGAAANAAPGTAFQADSSYLRATLKQLRESDPSRPDRSFSGWGVVLAGANERLCGKGDNPSPAEAALLGAMHLFAVHAQSARQVVHVSTNTAENRWHGFGSAVRQLIAYEGAESGGNAIMRRFHAVLTATDHAERVYHLRQMISQLRTHSIPLDYVQLAEDLYRLQFAERADSVRLSWSRDIAISRKSAEDSGQETEG